MYYKFVYIWLLNLHDYQLFLRDYKLRLGLITDPNINVPISKSIVDRHQMEESLPVLKEQLDLFESLLSELPSDVQIALREKYLNKNDGVRDELAKIGLRHVSKRIRAMEESEDLFAITEPRNRPIFIRKGSDAYEIRVFYPIPLI